MRVFGELLEGLRDGPRVWVTDTLASCVAHRELMPSVIYRESKYLNTRAENSDQLTRQRERAMKRFTSPRHAQRFVSALGGICAPCRPRRYRVSATRWRTRRCCLKYQQPKADASPQLQTNDTQQFSNNVTAPGRYRGDIIRRRGGRRRDRWLPDSADLPDIDIDFEDDRRDEVFAYAATKYG